MWGENVQAKPVAQAMLRESEFRQALSNETEMSIRGVDNGMCCFTPKYDVYGQNGKMLAIKGDEHEFTLVALPANKQVGSMSYTSKNGPSRFEVVAANGSSNIKLGSIRNDLDQVQCCVPSPLIFEEEESKARLLTLVSTNNECDCGLGQNVQVGRFEEPLSGRYIGELWKKSGFFFLDNNSARYTLQTNAEGVSGDDRTMALFMALVTMKRELANNA